MVYYEASNIRNKSRTWKFRAIPLKKSEPTIQIKEDFSRWVLSMWYLECNSFEKIRTHVQLYVPIQCIWYPEWNKCMRFKCEQLKQGKVSVCLKLQCRKAFVFCRSQGNHIPCRWEFQPMLFPNCMQALDHSYSFLVPFSIFPLLHHPSLISIAIAPSSKIMITKRI